MLDKLIDLDWDIFLWFNTLGSTTWDPVWEIITKFPYWLPVFALVIYTAFKKLGKTHAFLVLGMVALLILFTDQTTNLIKFLVKRPRPCNNPEIADAIRAVIRRKSFSFVSGHASNSMAVTFLTYKILRPYTKYIGLFFLWPLIFGYSRIYLGLHYPGDILCGYLYGIFTGWLVYQLYKYIRTRFAPKFD
ncbi:phosphoesterase [Flavobacterium akiainvivens]|uniref:Phosphoesterase n=1 Tax=Flavobacterium akiainvivens TaxID=1202724 RepID=A0A0M9VIC2_9FLAO|nr:phosphatase PAP2 family protein [Flavobacterium akiainvivens]KOS06520.1 phosphoesterase [Flavobacterium akiainvivens]SFQ11523.1 undecaprenyl-diphosphatase [Flavobacterium akiainvivens]